MEFPRRLVREGGPRVAVLVLALGSAVLLPGLVVRRATAPLPAPQPTADATRAVAVFTLECDEGVFSSDCLSSLELLTRALETDQRVAGPVRSLARARWVSGEVGTLRPAAPRVEPLVPEPPRDDAALRLLRARVRADAALGGRMVRSDERAVFVVAALAPDLSAARAANFVEAVRSRFDRPPRQSVEVRLELAAGKRHWISSLLGYALGVALLAIGVALGGARLGAAASLAGVAALVWFRGALAAGSGFSSAAASLGLALALFGGACAALPLLHRARAELRRGTALAPAVGAGLAFAAPPASIALAAFAASGLAAPALCLALLAALAAALLAAAALVPSVREGGYGGALDFWVEHALLRLDVAARSHPRALGLLASALAIAAFAGWLGEAGEGLRAGPPRAERWIADAGSAGGALEPAFLEGVEAFQRELATRPGVRSASSLVDAVLAPVQRAAHDGDPLFATVPPTRADVERALAIFTAEAPGELEGRIDAEGRWVAIEVLTEPIPLSPGRRGGRVLLALGLVFVLATAWLRSASVGAVVTAPAALAAISAIGARASPESAALSMTAAAFCALLVVGRARALADVGAERGVAFSLALRDAGRPSAALAFAGAGVAALCASTALAFAPLFAATLGLGLPSVLARALSRRALAPRRPLRGDVSPAVGSVRRRGTDASL